MSADTGGYKTARMGCLWTNKRKKGRQYAAGGVHVRPGPCVIEARLRRTVLPFAFLLCVADQCPTRRGAGPAATRRATCNGSMPLLTGGRCTQWFGRIAWLRRPVGSCCSQWCCSYRSHASLAPWPPHQGSIGAQNAREPWALRRIHPWWSGGLSSGRPRRRVLRGVPSPRNRSGLFVHPQLAGPAGPPVAQQRRRRTHAFDAHGRLRRRGEAAAATCVPTDAA